jgi:hypothetical protein
MRKLILFIFSVAMIVGGLYWVADAVFWSPIISARWISGGVLIVALGLYLLWVDFAAPALGIKTWEN